MRNVLKNELRRLSAYCLPVIFLIYLGSVSLFTHSHIVNGSTIVHSHPGNAPDHSHTEGEFNILELITHFCAGSDAVHILNVDGPVFAFVATVSSHCPFHAEAEPQDSVFRRGPPMFS